MHEPIASSMQFVSLIEISMTWRQLKSDARFTTCGAWLMYWTSKLKVDDSNLYSVMDVQVHSGGDITIEHPYLVITFHA